MKKANSTIKRQIESAAAWNLQKALFGLLVGSLGLMVLVTMPKVRAANNGAATVNINVDAGALETNAVPTTLAWGNVNVGGESATANLGPTNINDLRGTNAGWKVYGFFTTNLVKNTDNTAQIAISTIGWFPTTGTAVLTNVSGDLNEATEGADVSSWNGLGVGDNEIMYESTTTNDNGVGEWMMNNMQMNINVPLAAPAGTYNTTLNITLITK